MQKYPLNIHKRMYFKLTNNIFVIYFNPIEEQKEDSNNDNFWEVTLFLGEFLRIKDIAMIANSLEDFSVNLPLESR